MATISMLGAGGWGTALAILFSTKGHAVRLWARTPAVADELRAARTNHRYLPGVLIPTEVEVTHKLGSVGESEYIFWVTPSTVLGEIAKTVASSISLHNDAVLISCVKGLAHSRLLRMSEVLSEVFPKEPVAVLSGPNHAEEVARESVKG